MRNVVGLLPKIARREPAARGKGEAHCSEEKPRSHALRGNASQDAPRPGENPSAAIPSFPRRRASHPLVPTQSVGTRKGEAHPLRGFSARPCFALRARHSSTSSRSPGSGIVKDGSEAAAPIGTVGQNTGPRFAPTVAEKREQIGRQPRAIGLLVGPVAALVGLVAVSGRARLHQSDHGADQRQPGAAVARRPIPLAPFGVSAEDVTDCVLTTQTNLAVPRYAP